MIGVLAVMHLNRKDSGCAPLGADLGTEWPLGSPAIAPDVAWREAELENGQVLAATAAYEKASVSSPAVTA